MVAHDSALSRLDEPFFATASPSIAPNDLSKVDRRVYDLLVSLAKKNKPCPRNRDFCRKFGFLSIGTPTLVLQRLERLGCIRIETYIKRRIIHIIETGTQTSTPSGPLRPWIGRHRRSTQPSQTTPNRDVLIERPHQPLPPAPPSRICLFYAGDPRHDPPCGEPSLVGYSYCPEHKLICYLPPGTDDEDL